MSLPAHAVARPETRVEGFFPSPLKSASADLDQTAGLRWENPGCGYDFASGVCKYLYAHADPVNGIDPSGHMTLNSVMITVSTWGFMAANLAYRAAPALNRATVILFEASTGNSVFVGGAGAVVALKHGTKLGGVGWSTWQYVGNLLGRSRKIGTYDELAAGIRGNGIGEAANHLNQAAVFSRVPHGEGVSIVMGGPTSRAGTSHNLFHQTLEDFWTLFRTGSRRFTRPSNAEYDEVLQKALENAGHAADEASELVKLAREARKSYGYFDGQGGLLPEIPGRMPLPR